MWSNFNWVDYVFLAILFSSVLIGFARGLFYEIVALIAWIAAVVLASLFADSLANFFTSFTQVENVVISTTNATGMNTSQPISYVAIGLSFILIFAGVLLIGKIINSLFAVVGALSITNRFLGGLFGFCRGLLVNLVIIFLVQLTSLSAQLWWGESQIVTLYQPATRWLEEAVSPSLAELQLQFREKLQNLNATVQSDANSVVNNI